MDDLVNTARSYVANNAAESGADTLLLDMADEIERLRAEKSMWQPISTAPADGSEVLLFGRRDGEPVYAVDWYRQPKDECGFIGFGSFNESYWPATHWMPLPAPPDRKE